MSQSSLSAKTAIVTGGSRGIGRAVALKLASRGVNIAVVYAGNTEMAEAVCAEAAAMGVTAIPYQCDVADFAAVKRTVAAIKKAFPSVDILVNCAGITRDGLLAMMKEDQYDAVLDTNLKGTFNFIRQCTPIFMKARGGKIINISSVAGIMGNPGQANYSASKAGVIGLTKSVARELASRNVCCNAIAPGMIETDMTAGFSDEDPIVKNIPLGRRGQPEEIAALVSFLAGDEANYITGEVIRVDGGLAI